MSFEFRAYRGERTPRRISGRARPEMTLRELVDRWKAARRPSPKTVHSVTVAAEEFIALIGDRPIGTIFHEEMFEFRDRLSLLPACRTQSERTIDPQILIERFENGDDCRPRLAPTTVGKKLNGVQALIGFAYAERWIDEDDVHNIPVRKKPMLGRRPFTKDELARLFALRLFTSPWNRPERPHHVSDETVRWLMLLGLMTGARLEELCQLTLDDVVYAEGRWQIVITDSDASGPTDQKHLKSESSRRMVPVHRRLTDVGLLRLRAQRKDMGEMRLFPELERDQFDRLSGRASRRCNSVIDRVSKDPRLCFHSLRHFFKTLCRSARLEDSTNDQLTGHAPPSIGRRYGEGVELPVLAEELDKLDFEFINWEPILRAVEFVAAPRRSDRPTGPSAVQRDREPDLFDPPEVRTACAG